MKEVERFFHDSPPSVNRCLGLSGTIRVQFFLGWEELEEPMHISRNPSIETLPSLPAFIPFPFGAMVWNEEPPEWGMS